MKLILYVNLGKILLVVFDRLNLFLSAATLDIDYWDLRRDFVFQYLYGEAYLLIANVPRNASKFSTSH